ncbi:hypothetical protein C1I93_07810 [Micromonospora endophytica]|uniref:Uncharacterized protein n=1 Tax=Micromonospora endophytica TaxID=515350 RepID=A0A2W2CH92_9ACTN|nr:hypothetical protein C1I93_07810 [Micromonospora endophytica]RIW43376.1 hypothetical protein D3H59_20655 [Micromonospora endophytica]BCJ58801.1 hypothetical protein Jiend_22230 [Micromonospora endophytica]
MISWDSAAVPNLDFYATENDWPTVLHAVFDSHLFRVFEADSEPDREVREFHTVDEVPAGSSGRHLMLFVVGSGPGPTAKRIDFVPGISDARFRYSCEGWGLIQLHYGGPFGDQELRWSHTNHNTEKRAAAWASTLHRLGDPAAWDWTAVTSASGKLNRAIRKLAIDKIGSHPVLPGAAQFIAAANLRHEYGTGIHAMPCFGG